VKAPLVIRLRVKATASALKSLPSWNLTPSRRWKRHVVSLTRSHFVASFGWGVPWLGCAVFRVYDRQRFRDVLVEHLPDIGKDAAAWLKVARLLRQDDGDALAVGLGQRGRGRRRHQDGAGDRR